MNEACRGRDKSSARFNAKQIQTGMDRIDRIRKEKMKSVLLFLLSCLSCPSLLISPAANEQGQALPLQVVP
jgi:hypothetical protein